MSHRKAPHGVAIAAHIQLEPHSHPSRTHALQDRVLGTPGVRWAHGLASVHHVHVHTHTGDIRRVIRSAGNLFDTGCKGARLLVWLILDDRVQPSLFIAGVIPRMAPCGTHLTRGLIRKGSEGVLAIARQCVSRGLCPSGTQPQF
jgi:hypothetical protein